MAGVLHELRDLSEYSPDNRAKDGLQSACKACGYIRNKKYRQDNPDSRKAYRLSEGFSCYTAHFPSGLYVGSGVTRSRRQRHLRGSSRIARKYGEKAIKFEVLFKGTEEQCKAREQALIDELGLNNLLNSNNVPNRRIFCG